jgi:hypothetical protein
MDVCIQGLWLSKGVSLSNNSINAKLQTAKLHGARKLPQTIAPKDV